MLIKIGQQQYINTQYIETICITGENEVRVYMINSNGNEFYKYGVYKTYEKAVNAKNGLIEIINKERKW